jgi:plasmid stabilization system protein ParE
MKYKIRINPVAFDDVLEMKAYIAENNPQAALKMGNAIYSGIEKLADFPEKGASLS